MKFCLALALAALSASAPARAANEFRQLTEIKALPVALDPAFSFRKTKILIIGDSVAQKNKRAASFLAPGVVRDPAIGFETSYRMFGAVTELDKRQRYGHYFDFFWRAKRAGPVTVRLEYQQALLHALTQAREVNYADVRKGTHKTEFAVIGDDFFADGRVLAWRCLLITGGKIVAENRSFLWK